MPVGTSLRGNPEISGSANLHSKAVVTIATRLRFDAVLSMDVVS